MSSPRHTVSRTEKLAPIVGLYCSGIGFLVYRYIKVDFPAPVLLVQVGGGASRDSFLAFGAQENNLINEFDVNELTTFE